MLRVGFLQFQPAFGDVAGNLDRIDRALAGVQADLVVLPELVTTGYNFTSREELAGLAEPVPGGRSTERLAAIAAREQVYLVAGLAESHDGRLYNGAALVGPGGWIGSYRKLHLYDREKLLFDPGDLGLPVFALPLPGEPRVGIMICFDWRFPEAARGLTLAGADLIAHPSNLVGPWCQAAMVTRCLENRIFAVTANRTGAEDRGGHRLGFTGRSQVIDPDGKVIAAADETEERLAIVPIDLNEARRKAINQNNDLLGDRRPEYYGSTETTEPRRLR